MHPIVIGLLNAIIPGTGYLIIRERLVLGTSMLIASVLFMYVTFTDPSTAFDSMLFAVSPLGRTLECISYLAAMIGFAYDAYDLATKQPLPTSST